MPKPIQRTVVGLAAVVALSAINVATASAATYTLRPDADVSSQWSKVGATSAWDALNDGVTQPTSVGTADYISSGGNNRVTEVGLTDRTLSNETITSGKAWFYAAAGLLSSAKAEIVANGTVRGSTTVSGGLLGSAAQWYSISFTPSDQATVSDLRLRFTSTGGSDVTVRAAYFDLSTTPAPSCSLSTPGSTIGMTLSGCTTVASDTAANADPVPFWGSIECQLASRHQQVSSGGDAHVTASSASQSNTAYRRLTVIDGDDFSGERCELGKNDHRDSPVTFYREGMRRVTFLSERLSSGVLSVNTWQTVFQMKQSQPSDGGGNQPALAMDAYLGTWVLYQSGPGPDGGHEIWEAPAKANLWTRFALDVVYSTDPSIGAVTVYVDLNGDGDFTDSGERSATIRTATLKTEIAGPNGSSDGYSPGDSLPSHLRAGIYHNPDIVCPAPSGCAVELDNVQVMAP
jgi:hypothetical protein